MPNTHHPLHLSAPVQFRSDSTGGVDAGTVRFSGKAYTGAVVKQYGERIIVDLNTLKFADRMPLLDTHEVRDVIGQLDQVSVENNEVLVEGRLFAGTEPAAEAIKRRSDNGIQYQMSIGVYDYRLAFLRPDDVEVINGEERTGPLTVLRHGHVRETSIALLGADDRTTASFFSTVTHQREQAMADENKTPGSDVEELKKEINDLNAKLSAANARAEAAESRLSKHLSDARGTDVNAVFSKLGVTLSDEQKAIFCGMSDEAWNEVKTQLMAGKTTKTELTEEQKKHLFSAENPSDGSGNENLGSGPDLANLNDVYRLRAEQHRALGL